MTTTARRRSARKLPPPDPETFEAGTWAGKPNYRCPHCSFATLDGTGDVVAHIAFVHRDQLSQAPKEE